jgi:copper chaperone
LTFPQGNALDRSGKKEIVMIRFSVPDMNCGHCTASIEKAIVTIDPHATVTCDLTARSVEVDNALDESALKAAIHDAGYGSERLT